MLGETAERGRFVEEHAPVCSKRINDNTVLYTIPHEFIDYY